MEAQRGCLEPTPERRAQKGSAVMSEVWLLRLILGEWLALPKPVSSSAKWEQEQDLSPRPIESVP